MIKRVCIFCASSQKIDPAYFEAARQLTGILVQEGIHIHFGAGAVGIMGAVADTALRQGGQITGFIPSFMQHVRWSHPDLTDLVVVKDLPERKARMISGVDAVIALPGGIGTLEELAEVITLKQLGQFLKPIVILNIRGFYDPLISFLDKMIRDRFMRESHGSIWQVVRDPGEVLPAIRNAPLWDESALHSAPA